MLLAFEPGRGGRAAGAHDFNPDRAIAATFQALPGASFVVNGAAQASDSALTTASVELKWRNGWSAAATFEGEFSEVTRSYAGKGRGALYVVTKARVLPASQNKFLLLLLGHSGGPATRVEAF
jgi:hypothetical protein